MNIYLANQEDTNLYKIGVTKKNPLTRLKELQTGNANNIILTESFTTKFDFKLETALHGYYKQKQVNSEWFELEDDDVKLFYSVCEMFEHNFKILKDNHNPFV